MTVFTACEEDKFEDSTNEVKVNRNTLPKTQKIEQIPECVGIPENQRCRTDYGYDCILGKQRIECYFANSCSSYPTKSYVDGTIYQHTLAYGSVSYYVDGDDDVNTTPVISTIANQIYSLAAQTPGYPYKISMKFTSWSCTRANNTANIEYRILH